MRCCRSYKSIKSNSAGESPYKKILRICRGCSSAPPELTRCYVYKWVYKKKCQSAVTRYAGKRKALAQRSAEKICLWRRREVVSDSHARDEEWQRPAGGADHQYRSFCRAWRRTGSAGLCHGQVFALRPLHEGVAA